MTLRRSICLIEPHYAFAGTIHTWKFKYTTHILLPKGTKLKFDLLSKGRPIDWQRPQINLKEKENLIWAELSDGKPITAKEIAAKDSIPQYEFSLPQDLKAGDTLTIFVGTPLKDQSTKKGNRSQCFIQRRRPFYLYIDPKGKGDYKEPEIFNLDVRGNQLHTIKIIAPSIVAKNKRFDVVVRFEDKFGNLTNNALEGTLIELTHEHLRESLNWKLFIPETGFINLPNLYFNEPGVYKIRLRNSKTQEVFSSPPIKCFSETDLNVHWGILHGESEKVDATENIEACLRLMRDENALHFFATSPFESQEETSNEIWKLISTYIAEFNEDDRFNTFLGFQWDGADGVEGLRQFIYTKDNKPILRKKEIKNNTLKKLYKSHTPKDLLSIPSFTMAKGFHFNFSDFNPEFEKVVEIYNAWGSSECTKKEGNPRPITAGGKKGISETEEGSIRNALNSGHRFGFVAGGFDDRGIFGSCFENDQVQYSPGLTAIITMKEQTRDQLVNALSLRNCYATTGERIILGINIAGSIMGGELSTKPKPGLVINRHISGYVAGTTHLNEIALIRNGTIIHTYHPKEYFFDFAFDDSDHLGEVVITHPSRPPFVYYYLRVIQEDGHMAWSSPIWIDYPEFTNTAPPKKKK